MQNNNYVISAATKYGAAQSEINSRVAARTTVNVFHMVTILSVTSVFFLAGREGEHEDVIWLIGAFIPLISTYFSCYYVHNDSIIGLLSAYCSALEKVSRDHTEDDSKYMPSWHSPQVSTKSWIQPSLEVRTYSDRTIQGLSIVSPFISAADLGLCSTEGFLLFMWCTVCSYYNFQLLSQVAERRKIYTEYKFNIETGEVDFNIPVFFPKTKKLILKIKELLSF